MGFIINPRLIRVGRYLNGTVFGRKNLLLTNCLLSTGLGSLGDSIQQHYDIIRGNLKKDQHLDVTSPQPATFNLTRNLHMSAAGFTTGLVSHYWYILLDRYLGTKRCLKLVTVKVLLDQIFFSPVNLLVYFGTIGVCERSTLRRIKDELIEKGFQNIYLAEWAIWPPVQYINFYLLPLRYRILFDNIISLGFDIYSPYVKYKKELKRDKEPKINAIDNVKYNPDSSLNEVKYGRQLINSV